MGQAQALGRLLEATVGAAAHAGHQAGPLRGVGPPGRGVDAAQMAILDAGHQLAAAAAVHGAGEGDAFEGGHGSHGSFPGRREYSGS